MERPWQASFALALHDTSKWDLRKDDTMVLCCERPHYSTAAVLSKQHCTAADVEDISNLLAESVRYQCQRRTLESQIPGSPSSIRRHSSAVCGAPQGASTSHAVLSAPGSRLLPLPACPSTFMGAHTRLLGCGLDGTLRGLVGSLAALVGEYCGLAGSLAALVGEYTGLASV